LNTFKEFEKSIKLRELFEIDDKIELKMICNRYMSKVIYYRLPEVRKMYKNTLNVNLGDIRTLLNAVSIRHELVHRNGKKKDGDDVDINSDIINNLISETESFISNIDKQIKQKTNEESKENKEAQ
jgi:hypothetical protein